MSDRSVWNSRLGFILASAGSAVGLGAIWKFPYMAGTNGGSVFLIPYIVFSLTLGLALLIGEMCLGRATRAGAATAFRRWGGPAGGSGSSRSSRAFSCSPSIRSWAAGACTT